MWKLKGRETKRSDIIKELETLAIQYLIDEISSDDIRNPVGNACDIEVIVKLHPRKD